MAVKKKAAKAPKSTGKSDAEMIQAAYEDAVKNQMATYITNVITSAPNADDKFLKGLKIIRDAKAKALQLITQ